MKELQKEIPCLKKSKINAAISIKLESSAIENKGKIISQVFAWAFLLCGFSSRCCDGELLAPNC